MKKSLALALSALLSGAAAIAQQTPPSFNASEDIDIANIRAAHLVHGDMWMGLDSGQSRCEYPKGSGKHIGSASSLWMSGYDLGQNLHLAAQHYRYGEDYWPGPIDTTGSATVSIYTRETAWAKIWKINHTTIDSFAALSSHTLTNTPAPILRWPAKGNPYATGNNGAQLTITRDMAPFIDVNGDGIYNPLQGDYPKMKGDQMLWWIFNDDGITHDLSNAMPLGIEVKTMAYAYKRGGAVDNMIFYEYELNNRSLESYDSFRVGFNADLDLGNAFDDYSGYDSSRRLGVMYNAKDTDGNGEATAYGVHPPVAGVAIMELPGDNGTSYAPAGSFALYNNINSGHLRNPYTAAHYNNLLRSRWTTGEPFVSGSRYFDSSINSECLANFDPQDRRIVLSSNNSHLSPNATIRFGMALVVCPAAGGCPNVDFTCIKAATDTAFIVYHNPLPPLPPATAIRDVAQDGRYKVYPNPVTDQLRISYTNTSGSGAAIQITDMVGRSVAEAPLPSKTGTAHIDVRNLQSGIYLYRILENGKTTQTGKMTKQ